MGVADLFDDRPGKVTDEDCVQHLLRYHRGHFAHGLRGARLVWAMANTVPLAAAAGEGRAGHRHVLKRMGGRVRARAEACGIVGVQAPRGTHGAKPERRARG